MLSRSKNTQEFPTQICPRNLAIQIARALRKIHPNENAAVKRISRTTGIEIRTIEKWFQATNAPNSKHLLTLMRHYPVVREVVYDLVIPPPTQSSSNIVEMTISDRQNQEHEEQLMKIYRVISDPINSAYDARKFSDLNLRQLWLLNEIAGGSNPDAGSIHHRWSISIETAKRDIAKLKRLGLIRFSGAKRNGRYELSQALRPG